MSAAVPAVAAIARGLEFGAGFGLIFAACQVLVNRGGLYGIGAFTKTASPHEFRKVAMWRIKCPGKIKHFLWGKNLVEPGCKPSSLQPRPDERHVEIQRPGR